VLTPLDETSLPTLREVIEALAPIERGPGSPGEAQAAEWLAERLRSVGLEAKIEEEEFLDGYARPMRDMAAAGALGGLLGLTRRGRHAGALLAGLAAAGMAEDTSNGPRVYRRASGAQRQTQNVVAVTGDPRAERTLVVMAHHDAAPTGQIFDPRGQRLLGETLPGIIERIDTSLPLWLAAITGPALAALGAAKHRRGLATAGIIGSAATSAVMADVLRSPIIPGANDNLTAVAVLVALAERLREEPLDGLRVLLVSCGAEEVVQGGIHGFARRHFPELDRERTWFLNLDTVGSPRLALLEGEGPLIMEDYPDRTFRDLVYRAAEREGILVRRGMRARNSTDAVIPMRAGYPTACLVSLDRNKALSNYHLPSDTPENVIYQTVLGALGVVEATARELAVNPWMTPRI
jgi:peptidase M28-like protein